MKNLANGTAWWVIVAFAALLLSSTAQANQYKILVTEAAFAERKRVGGQDQPWDAPDGKPDAYVVIKLGAQPVYVSGVSANALQARWFTGTEYWKLPMTTPVTITVRDADAGKTVAGAGMVGVALRPDIPRAGKRMISGALATVDTDDTIAVWSGTLVQLVNACGSSGEDLMRSATGQRGFRSNVGLTSLKVRVIERAPGFDVSAPSARQYLALTGAKIEKVKRGSRLAWDVGLSGTKQPDPRYLVYVNGSPVLAGGVNRDSFVATWNHKPAALDLRDDDTIAIALFDADAGSQLSNAGEVAALYSRSLTPDAKARVYEMLGKMSTDDLIFLWVGDWKKLSGLASLPRAGSDPDVWWNDGLVRAEVRTGAPAARRAAGAAWRLTLFSADIAATKRNGKAWDMGKGRPDPMVRCFVPAPGGGWQAIGESAPVRDSLRPVWRLTLTDRRLTSGVQVKIDVFDKDGVSNDLIGTMAFALPDKQGTYEMSGGGVSKLVLQLAPSSR